MVLLNVNALGQSGERQPINKPSVLDAALDAKIKKGKDSEIKKPLPTTAEIRAKD